MPRTFRKPEKLTHAREFQAVHGHKLSLSRGPLRIMCLPRELSPPVGSAAARSAVSASGGATDGAVADGGQAASATDRTGATLTVKMSPSGEPSPGQRRVPTEPAKRAARLGLSVGKKVGGAVVRVRVKRMIREAFRLERDNLPPLDLVVHAYPHEGLALSQYRALLVQLATELWHKSQRRRADRTNERRDGPPAPKPGAP